MSVPRTHSSARGVAISAGAMPATVISSVTASSPGGAAGLLTRASAYCPAPSRTARIPLESFRSVAFPRWIPHRPGVVCAYSGGTVPDLHRFPSWLPTRRTAPLPMVPGNSPKGIVLSTATISRQWGAPRKTDGLGRPPKRGLRSDIQLPALNVDNLVKSRNFR